MHESCVCLRVLFVNAVHTSVLGGYLSKCTVCTWKKHYLCLWFTGGIYEWECYFGREMLHIAEAYTSSGTVDEWVPADGENMHDHTGAKYGCHSKVDGHPQF